MLRRVSLKTMLFSAEGVMIKTREEARPKRELQTKTGTTRYTGPRFGGVGKDNPRASEHCPVVIEVTV
jgi:hypothetical protein